MVKKYDKLNQILKRCDELKIKKTSDLTEISNMILDKYDNQRIKLRKFRNFKLFNIEFTKLNENKEIDFLFILKYFFLSVLIYIFCMKIYFLKKNIT